MEYVDGEPLSALLRREGRLDPEVAAGYVLQAARGLKFAHDRGMVHRDVKPANLLLNRDGIVKVADLGLVKRLDGRQTGADDDALMGTPAFMAPEQVTTPRDVDARTDVYSLGCTLYDLLTGRPPFEGETAGQVISMHVRQMPVAPAQRNHRVPGVLSELVLRMIAKKPDQRFADMGGVIAALERFLGVEAGVAFSPREEHAALLEQSVAAFNGATWAGRRSIARVAYVALALAVVGGALGLGFRGFALWAGLFLFTSALTSLVIDGVVHRSPLLVRLRQWVLGASLWAWAATLALLGLGIAALAWFGQLRPALENLGLAAALGLVPFLALDRRVVRERRPLVQAVEAMLKGMRLRGLEEQTLRQFVCRYSGAHWEAFYEALFGYDAKLDARARWGRDERGEPRKRHRAWRDPFIRLLDRRLERRRAQRDARRKAKPTKTRKLAPSGRPVRARGR
jgi:hypothetical protein